MVRVRCGIKRAGNHAAGVRLARAWSARCLRIATGPIQLCGRWRPSWRSTEGASSSGANSACLIRSWQTWANMHVHYRPALSRSSVVIGRSNERSGPPAHEPGSSMNTERTVCSLFQTGIHNPSGLSVYLQPLGVAQCVKRVLGVLVGRRQRRDHHRPRGRTHEPILQNLYGAGAAVRNGREGRQRTARKVGRCRWALHGGGGRELSVCTNINKRRTWVSFEPRNGKWLAPESSARMHSLSASRLLLISAPS